MVSATEKRLLREAKEASPVMVSGDALIKLVSEIGSLRQEVARLRQEVQSNFDSMVEHIPTEVHGGVQFKAFNADRDAPVEETYKRVTVLDSALLIEPWSE